MLEQRKSFILSILCIFFHIKYVVTLRNDIHNMMYEKFDSAAACFRVLNGTHQFGCSSALSGNLGVIQMVEDQSDVDWLLQKAQAGPYMVVVGPEMFTSSVMLRLRNSASVSGILLAMNGSARPEHFSPDDTCPNRYSGLGQSSCSPIQPWNPFGSSFLLVDWQKPIFVLKDSAVITKIRDCYSQFNMPRDATQSDRALCSLRMKAHMYAAVNSPTCLYRSSLYNTFNPLIYCDPMGDQNIVLPVLPLRTPSNLAPASVVMVTARLDSATMFDGLAPSAMSSVTGIVTLLATARLLYTLLPPHSVYKKNVVFVLINGEAHDYIGSGRIAYDMAHGKFPTEAYHFSQEHIGMLVDVSQLGTETVLHCHYNSSPAKTDPVKELIRSLDELGKNRGLHFVLQKELSLLPPSSLQTFLRFFPGMPGFVIANHVSQYTNRYYNGFLDNAANLQFKYANGSEITSSSVQSVLANIATTLALALYKTLTEDDYKGTDTIKPELIDEMLHCYLESMACPLFASVLSADAPPAPPGPPSFYVGVSRSPNQITTLTGILLASFASGRTNDTEAQCVTSDNTDSEFQYMWITGNSKKGECVKTTLKFTPAVSPAFEITDYDWTSNEYSTWTESVWQEVGLQMFLKPAHHDEVLTFCLGLVVLFLSFLSVYFVNARSHILFNAQMSAGC